MVTTFIFVALFLHLEAVFIQLLLLEVDKIVHMSQVFLAKNLTESWRRK